MSISDDTIRQSLTHEEAQLVIGFLRELAWPVLNHKQTLAPTGQNLCTTFGAWFHIAMEDAAARADHARRGWLLMLLSTIAITLVVATSTFAGATVNAAVGLLLAGAFHRWELRMLQRAVHFKRLSGLAADTLASSMSQDPPPTRFLQ